MRRQDQIRDKRRVVLSLNVLYLASVIAMVAIGDPFMVLVLSLGLALPYLAITRQQKHLPALVVALLVALTWTAVVGDRYAYAHTAPAILDVNLYSAVAWAIGLLAAWVLHTHLTAMFGLPRLLAGFAVFALLYWVGLIALESWAYHVVELRNIPTGAYQGIPLFDCLHAPRWMQIGYFLLGPTYFLLAWRSTLRHRAGVDPA